MTKFNFKLFLPALLSILWVLTINAQTWDVPVLSGSTLNSGTSYYLYNVGSKGYLTRGGGWSTQAVVSAQPQLNASSSIIKWTATNTEGSIWTFQYNLNELDIANSFLCPTNPDPLNGDVYTDDFDFANRIRTWNVVQTDAVNNIYSIQIVSSYGGYVASQYLGSAATTELTNRGIANTVKYNRENGNSYVQWKFVNQADIDLYKAKVLLDKYMTLAKNKGMDVSTYITTYNAGVTADINTAANDLLTALDRVDVTSSITNPSFETNSFSGWTNNGFVTQSNAPGMGWTKNGTYYAEKWIASGSYLGTSSLTQTVSGLSNGLYELVVSGHAVQQAGANLLHTGAFVTAGLQSTEVVAGKEYSISNIVVNANTLTVGYSLQVPIACNWTGFDDFRLYYYGPVAIPVISTSKSEFAFIGNDNYVSDNLTVTGANLTEGISISAPTGISVSPASLTSDADNVTVTVTYDGTTTVNGNIVFSSGSATKSVAVTASPNTGCFTALYPTGNLVTDPFCKDLATYRVWGTTTIVTDGNAYCGSSVRVTGDGGGSIDYTLTGKISANTAYRLKAMMYTNGNGAALVLNGCGINGTTSHFVDISTNGTWEVVDFNFLTGTLGTSQYFWFNSYESVNGIAKTASDIRLDNFEIYAMPTWNGTGSWNTAANWGGSVPTSGADVFVASGTLTIDQNVSVANLTVYPGAKVVLSSGSSLTVTGDLLIKSDANGTGTFVDQNAEGELTVSGSTTVQQYLSGANNATVPNGRFWYISSPVSDATSAVFNAAGASKLWNYTESTHAYTEITDNSTGLAVGTGYVVRLDANTTVNFSGSLHPGSKTIGLTRASDSHEKRGYNLIGNPYPSFLDYHAVTLPASVLPTIWTRSYNASGNAMAFDTYNSELNAGVSGSGATITQYVAPMQAFWVKVADGNTTGSITLTNAMRYVSDQTEGGNKLKVPAMSTQQLLRLQVSNGLNNDEALIAFNENASNDFDRFDSPKMPNDNAAFPEIYTMVGSEKVAINGLKSMVYDQVLPLGFKTGVSNTFSITATEILNFDADTKVVLMDNLLNSELDITDGTSYTFSSDVVNNASRFGIVFKSASFTTNEKHSNLQLNVYVNENGQITINSNDAIGQEGLVTVYNAVGQMLVNTSLTGSSTVISKSLNSGVYFVMVNVTGKNTTHKLIIN